MTSQGSETGTGCIEQNSLEAAFPAGTVVLKRCRISRQRRNRAQTEPRSISSDPLQSALGAIHGPDFTVIVHQFRQMGALATGSRTGIEDSITWQRLQQRGYPLSRPVLHAPVARLISRPTAQITAVPLHLQTLGAARDGAGGHSRCRKILLNCLAAASQRIDPQIQGGHLVTRGGHCSGSLSTPPLEQQGREPVRQGVLEGQSLSHIGRPLEFLTRLLGPLSRAEETIHHRRQPRQSPRLRQRHTGVDRC